MSTAVLSAPPSTGGEIAQSNLHPGGTFTRSTKKRTRESNDDADNRIQKSQRTADKPEAPVGSAIQMILVKTKGEVIETLVTLGWDQFHQPESSITREVFLERFAKALHLTYKAFQVYQNPSTGKLENRISALFGRGSQLWVRTLAPARIEELAQVQVKSSTSVFQDATICIVPHGSQRGACYIISPPAIVCQATTCGVGQKTTPGPVMIDPAKNVAKITITGNYNSITTENEIEERELKIIDFFWPLFLKQMKAFDLYVLKTTFAHPRLHLTFKEEILQDACKNLIPDFFAKKNKSWKMTGQDIWHYNNTPISVEQMCDPNCDWMQCTHARKGKLGDRIMDKYLAKVSKSSYAPPYVKPEDPNTPSPTVNSALWQNDEFNTVTFSHPMFKRGDRESVAYYKQEAHQAASEIQKSTRDDGLILETILAANMVPKTSNGQTVVDSDGKPIMESLLQYLPPTIEKLSEDGSTTINVEPVIPKPGWTRQEILATERLGRRSTVSITFYPGFSESRAKGFHCRHRFTKATIYKERRATAQQQQKIEVGAIVVGGCDDGEEEALLHDEIDDYFSMVSSSRESKSHISGGLDDYFESSASTSAVADDPW